jgi:hypothetical protein
MPTERTRGERVREPIPESEWIERRTLYYNDAQRQKILSTFERRLGADDRSFLDCLEIEACFFVHKARSVRKEPHRPHEANRDRDSIIRTAKDLIGAIEKLSVPAREDISLAATQLARANHKFGETIPSNVIRYDGVTNVIRYDSVISDEVYVREFNTNQWITRIKTDLEWLARCSEHANSRNLAPIRIKTPDGHSLESLTWSLPPAGNRADGPLLAFIEAIVSAYADHAKRPAKPKYNKTKKADSEPEGELLDLIHTCLAPLGITKNKAAVFKILERLLESAPRFRDIFKNP